jgi:peptidoglycan/xylan/chitin deacetylase (PgdA/CDA1 family)
MRRRSATILAVLLLLVVGAGSSGGVTAAATATAVSHGPRQAKVIALTFDDGSSPDNCRRILAELLAAGVPATFFPIAEAMPLDPGFWRLVVAAGDPIGDHTMTHPQMPQLGYAAQVRQLKDARSLVESIAGHPILDVFRPPYGEYDARTLAAAAATGFPVVLTWDTSLRDTSPRGTLAEMLAAAELGTNGSVILMHCGPNATPYLVPKVIDFYRGRGFRLVTVPDLLGVRWDPGTLAPITADQVLGSLAPLPATSKGGPIVGIGGWQGPAPSVPPASQATPRPTTTPTATPSPTPSLPPATPPIPTFSPSPAPAETPGVTVTPAPAVPSDATDTPPAEVLLLIGAIGALVVVLLGVAAARRRPR